MIKYFSILNIMSLLCLSQLLIGCSGVRDQLGINREAPDEFLVKKHAPLEMPRSLALPPPQKGMQRPQEKTVETRAKEAVFGNKEKDETTTSQSISESQLLEKTGALDTNSSIRETVDFETDQLEDKNQPALQKLMNWGEKQPAPASVIDAKKEYKRIQERSKTGEAITGEDVPILED